MASSLTFMQKGDFIDVVKIKDGGYGTIYKGTHRDLGYQAAIKKLKTTNGAADSRYSADLVKEIGILQLIRHPYIVYVYGFINQPGSIAMVMELAECGSLKDFLQLLLPEQPPVSIIVRMMHQIALGMVFLHGRTPSILHLDLKAANVLVTGELVVKIADFGLSEWRQYQEQHTTTLMRDANADLRGTVTHVPPEKLIDVYIVPGKKYDVYGFSILSWELASSKRAFDGIDASLLYRLVPQGERPSLSVLHRDLPPKVLQLIQDCWHADPVQRPDFTAIRTVTEDVLHRYDQMIKNDEISLKNLVYQRQAERQPKRSCSAVPVQESRPVNAQEISSMQPKHFEATCNPSFASPTVNCGKLKSDEAPLRILGSQVSVERQTSTQPFNTDLSALKSDSRAPSVSTLSTNSGSLPSPQRSLQLDGASSCSAEDSRVYPTVVNGKGYFGGTASDSGLTLGRNSDTKQKQPTTDKGKASHGSNPSELELGNDLHLDTDAAPPQNQHMDHGTARSSAMQPSARPPGKQSNSERLSSATQAPQGTRAMGRSSSCTSSTTLSDNPTVSSLKGPHSQSHRPQSAQGVSASGSYPQYVPHQGGFLYYPCPDVSPVFLHAVNGQVPPGMPAPGSMFPGSTSIIQGPNTIINSKHGTTRVISSSGISNMQVGNKNIMYIGAMPGSRSGSKRSTQTLTPFDKSKITNLIESKRQLTLEDIDIISVHIGNSWKPLARKLGFSDGQIDGFDHDNGSLQEKAYQMLSRYRQRFGDDATVDPVVGALCTVQKPDVAALLPHDASVSPGTGSADGSSVTGKNRSSVSGSLVDVARRAGNSGPVLFSLGGAPAAATAYVPPLQQHGVRCATDTLRHSGAAPVDVLPRAASADDVVLRFKEAASVSRGS